jgi:type I restriction enzyme M protein
LTKGYQPKDIVLEKVFPSGHGHSGRLDILVQKDKRAFLMIESGACIYTVFLYLPDKY